MKKFLFFLLAFFLFINAEAELTIRQVCQKSVAAIDLTKGIKGKCKMSALGMGETVSFACDTANVRITQEEGVDYFNISSCTCYSYNKADNTLTIDNDVINMMMIMPFMTIMGLSSDKPETEKLLKGAKMSKTREGYEIKIEVEGTPIIVIVDANTFHIKEMKIKKFLITVMSMSYSSLAPFHDLKSLKFDQSKFPTAKVIDERGKK